MKKSDIGKKQKTAKIQMTVVLLYLLFIFYSFVWNFQLGKSIAYEGWTFLYSLVVLFPPAFLLISLFEVWVDKKIIEAHLGEKSSIFAHLWSILLACTIMAPLIVALPVAHSLSKKGARLSIVISFLGASTICRIPMTVFEATYLGIPFSTVRLLTSIPLVIIFSEIIGKIFSKTKLSNMVAS